MKPDLLLFTDHYPYGTSEPFLSDELSYLSSLFDKIIIVPLDTANASKRRDIPGNAVVFTPKLNNFKSKYSLILRGLMGKGSCKVLADELFQTGAWKSVHKLIHWMTVTLLIRTYLPIFYKIVKELKHPENTVLYFYWGQRWSQIIPFIPDKFKNIFVRLHGSDLYEFLYHGYIPFRRQQLEAATGIFAISQVGVTYLNQRYPEFHSRIQLARLGTRDHGLNPFYAGEDQPLVVVSCAGITKIKRVDLIPEILRHADKPIQWHHFGDGPEMESLAKKCRELPSHVTFKLYGQVSHDTLMEFYQRNHVSVFMNVSSSEGVPVSIMEAFSFGIPVVATDVGGTGELVNSTNGRLIPKDFSPSETGQLLEDLFRSNELILMRKAARESWELTCNAAKVYPEFIHALAVCLQTT